MADHIDDDFVVIHPQHEELSAGGDDTTEKHSKLQGIITTLLSALVGVGASITLVVNNIMTFTTGYFLLLLAATHASAIKIYGTWFFITTKAMVKLSLFISKTSAQIVAQAKDTTTQLSTLISKAMTHIVINSKKASDRVGMLMKRGVTHLAVSGKRFAVYLISVTKSWVHALEEVIHSSPTLPAASVVVSILTHHIYPDDSTRFTVMVVAVLIAAVRPLGHAAKMWPRGTHIVSMLVLTLITAFIIHNVLVLKDTMYDHIHSTDTGMADIHDRLDDLVAENPQILAGSKPNWFGLW